MPREFEEICSALDRAAHEVCELRRREAALIYSASAAGPTRCTCSWHDTHACTREVVAAARIILPFLRALPNTSPATPGALAENIDAAIDRIL